MYENEEKNVKYVHIVPFVLRTIEMYSSKENSLFLTFDWNYWFQLIVFDKKCILTKFHLIMSPLSEIISETIENNEKLENNRKSFSFNFFDDFVFWSTENTKIQLLSKSESIWTINTVFNKKTKKNNRKNGEQKKNLYF